MRGGGSEALKGASEEFSGVSGGLRCATDGPRKFQDVSEDFP